MTVEQSIALASVGGAVFVLLALSLENRQDIHRRLRLHGTHNAQTMLESALHELIRERASMILAASRDMEM